MPDRPRQSRHTSRAPRRWHHRLTLGAAIVAIGVGSTIVVATASTSHATPQLQSVNAKGYNGVLANSKGFSLYVLSTESATKLHCTAGCLKIWPPFLVKSSVKSVTKTKAVKGKIAFVKRSATTKQVTYNGYPVYRYTGDTGPKQSNGEGVKDNGGTWTLVGAASTKTSTTPVKPKATLTSTSANPYTAVLARSDGRSLYVLSVESGGTLHCTAGCTGIWPPLLVSNLVTSVTVGAGVKGTVGFVKRSATMNQVTFNGFPVYVYYGDTGAGQSNGEGTVADGGTWYLASAAATTSGTTEIPPAPPGSTTTTTYYYPPG